MTTLTQVQSFAGAVANTNHISFGALSGAFPGNVAHGWMVYFRETSGDSGAFQYLLAKGDGTGAGQRVFTDSIGGAARYGMESTGNTLAPSRGTTTVYTQAQWHCLMGIYDGAGVASTDIKIYHSINGGAFVEATYSSATEGGGSIVTDALDSFVIGNRPGSLDRPFKGRLAYVGHFDLSGTPITSASQVQTIFDNGPLSDSRCDFLWANGADLVGGKTPTSTGSGVTVDTVNLPPNTQLGSLSITGTGTAVQQLQVASGTGTVSIPNITGTGAAIQQLQIASGNGTVGNDVTGTGNAIQQLQIASGSGTVTSPAATTTLDANFAGANANTTLSSVSNANTMTPTVVIRVRSPEDSEWQQALYKLNDVAGKTLTNQILLAEKEDDPDAFLGSWEGPWWSTDPSAGPEGWTNVAWSQVSGDRITFTLSPGAANTIYVATMPPWTQTVVAAWIASLESAFPTYIHDDLPSRVALGGAAYVCALSGSGVDENGRSISNLPIYGFRIGNDSAGTFPKRRIVLFSGVHSGEWYGGAQLRGFVAELLTGIHSATLLAEFDFYVYPLHSIKGNYLGFRRNEAASSFLNNADANREWADGDGTLATVVQVQGILDVDHGVAHSEVKGFFDFHDGKNVSDVAWFYYFTGQTGFTEFGALVAAENAEIVPAFSAIASGTTSQYWMGKGVNFAWTCEMADEKSTYAEAMGYGAAYARAVKTAEDAGMLGSPASNVTGAGAATQQLQIAAGTGTVTAPAITGTGQAVQQLQIADAVGVVINPITGIGNAVQPLQVASGTGVVGYDGVISLSPTPMLSVEFVSARYVEFVR